MSNWGINVQQWQNSMQSLAAYFVGIHQRLNNLQQSIALLEETTDLLRERMLPTLRSEPPDDQCRAEKESREATTPLGTELYHFTNRVNNVATQLRDLLNRCEL